MGCTGGITTGAMFPDGINILLKNRDNGTHVNPKPAFWTGNPDIPPYSFMYTTDPAHGGCRQGMNVRGLAMAQHVLNGVCTCCGGLRALSASAPKLRPGKMPDEDDAYGVEPDEDDAYRPLRMSTCTDLTPEGKEACEAAGCHWYFDSCHTYAPNLSTVLKYCEHAEDALNFLASSEQYPTAYWVVGIIDRFGVSGYVYHNYSGTKIRYIDAFYGQGNEWHCCDENYPDYGFQVSGCSQRCSRMNYRLYESYAGHGHIGFRDIVRASRDQNDGDLGTDCYDMNHHPTNFRLTCNLYTQNSFLATNVDSRYDGKLCSIWCNYGRNAVIGIFLPTMIWGDIPSILTDGNGFNDYINPKRISAQTGAGCSNYWYKPERVREIQQYSFYAENWGWQQYLNYLANLPDDLTDQELWDSNSQFNLNIVTAMANIYINEELPPGTIDDTKTFTIEII